MFASKRVVTVAACLVVSAPNIALAQQTAVDSVRVGTTAPASRAVVVVRAANVSWARGTPPGGAVKGPQRETRGRYTNTNK